MAFNTTLLKDRLKDMADKKVKFYIGVDACDKDVSAYCLCRVFDGIQEVIILKESTNKHSFVEEVENLAKYFNADIIASNSETTKPK